MASSSAKVEIHETTYIHRSFTHHTLKQSLRRPSIIRTFDIVIRSTDGDRRFNDALKVLSFTVVASHTFHFIANREQANTPRLP